MTLTADQQATLRTWITANFPAAPNTVDGSKPIADALNAAASPDYFLYKSSVVVTEIGDAINGSELVGLTALNLQRVQALVGDLCSGSINPGNKDRRDAFNSIFSGAGGTITRPSLASLWQRTARVVEKLYAAASPGSSGTRGSTANPDTLVVEGTITASEVWTVRNS